MAVSSGYMYSSETKSTNCSSDDSFDDDGEVECDEKEKSKTNFAEVGAGYYYAKNRFRFETFAGYGFGKTTTYILEYIDSEDINVNLTDKYFRIYIQPGVGLVRDHFELGGAIRLAYVNFPNPKAFSGDNDGIFAEPAGVIRAGFESVKFFAEIGLSLRLDQDESDNNEDLTKTFDYNPFICAIGLSFNFDL